MRRIYKYIVLLIVMAFANGAFAQYEQITNLSEHIEKGKVRLKLKQEVFQQSAGLKSLNVSNASTTITGVTGIDRIGEQVGITRIKRVFPFSLKNEPKHREYGLHLWIEVEFDANVDVEYAVELYKEVAEVDIAKPLFKKVRLDGDEKAIKLSAGIMQKLKEGASASSNATLKAANAETIQPNDPLFGDQWHYETDLEKYEYGQDIELANGWSITSGDSSVIVAVVDGGIDVNHEDLSKHIWINEAELNGEEGVDDDQNGYVDDINGFNFIFYGGVTPHDHGTHVAGTVGAITNNGVGVAGVAGGGVSHTDEEGNQYTDNGVRMISCQVFDDRSSSSGNFAAAIVYGADNGAVISQNSWGYTASNYYEPEVYDAIKYFIAEAGQYEGSPMKGGILFFAAGNDALEQTFYPAAFDEVVAVTSVGPEGYPAPYTNIGEWTDIAAPGGDQTNYENEGGVLSTLPYNEYGYYQGTSMACPHVSGVAALVLSKYGGEDMTPDNLRNRIISSTRRFIFDHEDKYGVGLLNAPNALADDEKIAPEPIDDLEASEIFHNEVRLKWTIPVDEDNFQPAVLYLAVSGSEITAKNFDLMQQLTFDNTFVAGTQVQISLSGLNKNTDYWFAMKSEDQFGNLSEISNILKVTTTDSPQFSLSNNSINVNIDVTEGISYSEIVQLSNVGEGILYWQNYVENENIYWWLLDEDEQAESETITSAIQTQLNEKVAFSEANPELFEVPVNPENHLITLKSSQIAKKPADYWDYDETVFVAGMSYENDGDPTGLLSTYLPNAGLVQATRFDVAYDYTFNLTHLEVAMYNNVNDKPIVVEIKKGSTKFEDTETVYLQEYYVDTTEVFGYQCIPLYAPQRFEDGDVFWVVLHFPVEDEYPLGLTLDSYYPDIFLMSCDNGRTFFDAQAWRSSPIIPLVRALSTGDDGAYVFLKPGEGEIKASDIQDVEVFVDASCLTEGKHLASVTLMTNDDNKPYVSLEVVVNVEGQKPAVDTTDVRSYSVMQNVEHELELEIKNTGLGVLEIFDIKSDSSGVVKDFSDTISIYSYYTVEVPFKYTPSHTGVLQSKIYLITNHGVVGVPVSLNSTVPAGMSTSVSSNTINLAYGQAGALSLSVSNDGTGSDLEYDLSHYSEFNAVKNRLPETLVYDVISSNDVGGPAAGTWDDISEVGTYFDGAAVWEDTLRLESRVPFFSEVMETVWHGFGGEIYFLQSGQATVSFPAESIEEVGLGVMAPLNLIDSVRSFTLKECIFYAFGDKTVFTSTVKEQVSGDPNADTPTMTYQVVLYRNGIVEYRYKDVSALTPEMDYTVALQGFTTDEYALYKNLGEDKPVSNGLVVRFTPQIDASMIKSASPETGYLRSGENETVDLIIDPSMYDNTAGTYNNVLKVKANTAAGYQEWPLSINITGSEEFEANDTLRYELIKVGHTSTELLKVSNSGSAAGSIQTISFSNPAFTCNVTLPYSINAKAHRFLPIEFSPVVNGKLTGTITLSYSNGFSESVRLETNAEIDPVYTHTIPSSITIDATAGEVASVPFSVNALASGADLQYSFVNGLYSGVTNATVERASVKNGVSYNDLYSYNWSIDTLGILHKWQSIEDDKEVFYIKEAQQQALALPFELPYYGEMYDTIWISKNGYVSVIEPVGEPIGYDFEAEDGVAGMIAPFWSDLNPSEDGQGVWVKNEDNRVVIEWNNVKPVVVDGGFANGGNITFQLEILVDGRIYFHYKDLKNFSGILQYGLESPDETESLNHPKTWILNWTDLYDNRSIAINPPLKSTITSGSSVNFNFEVDGDRLYKTGTYNDTIVLVSNSFSQPELIVPIQVNFTGSPKLEHSDSLVWTDVVYKDNLTVNKDFELRNTGCDNVIVTHIKHSDIADIAVLDNEGEVINIASTGKLTYPIEINPWEVNRYTLIALVNTFNNVDGKVTFVGNFTSSNMAINIQVVDSPVFDWNASDQTFNINASEGGSYTFDIENKGESKLNFELVPAIVPKGGDESGPGVVDEVGNYSFDLPNTVDSLVLDSKEKADGIFTPLVRANPLAFCNEFVAPEGGMFITHVKAWTYLKQIDQYVNVMIYEGYDEALEKDDKTIPQSGTKVYDQNYVIDQSSDGQWVIYPLATPVTIPAGETFFVMVTPPVDKSFVGYDISTDQKILDKVWVGVYAEKGNYNFIKESMSQVHKIRPLTAAGKGQWIELDNYSGELAGGEQMSITATFDAELTGPGAHSAKMVVKSNDVNRATDNFNIDISVNGAPQVVYHPNVDADTLKVREWDELVLNMMASDPEGEKLTFELIQNEDNPKMDLKELNGNTVQLKLKTDYEGQGMYTYSINISDEAGNITRDSIIIEVEDLNRVPYLNPEYEIIYLNIADPMQGYTIDTKELFIDEDGDELNILAGNYTPEMVDLALGARYITINPLQEGTGYLVFAADDGKENGYVIYGVYVVVINDPDAVDGEPNASNPFEDDRLADGNVLKIYPNPSVNGITNVAYYIDEKGSIEIEVLNMVGRQIISSYKGSVDEGYQSEQLNVSGFPKGIYIIRVVKDNQLLGTEKVIVN